MIGKNRKRPLVSIGMPIYNEELFLRKTLKSLLNQTYKNFEILISDNCSTDNTEKLCRTFSKNKRIKYSRNRENIGALANFNKTVALAKGKYFMWASGHDLWDKKYIEKCVDVLEKNKDVVVCHAQTINIDRSNKIISKPLAGINVVSNDSFTRVYDAISQLSLYVPFAIYGLIRLNVLKKTGLIKITYSSDHLLIMELAFFGKIVQLNEPLYYARASHLKENNRVKDAFKRVSPKTRHILYLTQSRLLFNYILEVWQIKLPLLNKFRLLLHVILNFVTKRIKRIIFGDFLRILIGETNLLKLRQIKKRFFIKKKN